jgi:hypothetical protein
VLLMPGFPQSHAMWHRIAPELADTLSALQGFLRGT